MIVRIKEGKHYRSNHLLTRVHIGKHWTTNYVVNFTDSCKYELTENKTQVNKLVGISLLPHHHFNSIRIGWRWDKDKQQIELLSYKYFNKSRSYKHICYVSLNEDHTIKISAKLSINKLFWNYDVFVNNYLFDTDVCIIDNQISKIPIMYECLPYFGGQVPAPHDISIKLFKYK